MQNNKTGAFILAIGIFLGLSTMGYLLANAAIDYKLFERSVTVKGLSEREYPADIVIWPIQFTAADNQLSTLYATIDQQTRLIKTFLQDKGINSSDISFSSPAITDKSAQSYGNNAGIEYRYSAIQSVTVYSSDIETVRSVMSELSDLGKQGIVFTGDNYQAQTEYLFTRLNDVKPAMIEEATRQAREVAEKFAADSQSKLGKIKRASQGQFSISARDKNNPHIKKIRVVSTVEYYLSD
ncbi:SIMPL domain-containing protein [Neptunicella sp.]|uniref:SIMPL domain-containing protein n=1 Tax=Neptunicella sp. TaxID=2125986 RepID=UPI003F6939D6